MSSHVDLVFKSISIAVMKKGKLNTITKYFNNAFNYLVIIEWLRIRNIFTKSLPTVERIMRAYRQFRRSVEDKVSQRWRLVTQQEINHRNLGQPFLSQNTQGTVK